MRARWSILTALALAFFLVAAPAISYAGDRHSGSLKQMTIDTVNEAFAQGQDEDAEIQGEESGGSEGQTDPEAETGSEASETDEAVTETGPPWTFQMGRMALVLTVLLGLAIIRMYYKLVVSRQKGAA